MAKNKDIEKVWTEEKIQQIAKEFWQNPKYQEKLPMCYAQYTNQIKDRNERITYYLEQQKRNEYLKKVITPASDIRSDYPRLEESL